MKMAKVCQEHALSPRLVRSTGREAGAVIKRGDHMGQTWAAAPVPPALSGEGRSITDLVQQSLFVIFVIVYLSVNLTTSGFEVRCEV